MNAVRLATGEEVCSAVAGRGVSFGLMFVCGAGGNTCSWKCRPARQHRVLGSTDPQLMPGTQLQGAARVPDRPTALPLLPLIPRAGALLPSPGLGVYRSAAGGECLAAVASALRLGYRHIDTAQLYGNEGDVGR